MGAATETLDMLDQLCGEAIALLSEDAVCVLDDNVERRFEVSSASEQNAQLITLANMTQDIKRVIHTRKASFSPFKPDEIIGKKITVSGIEYRILRVDSVADQVSYHVSLGSPQL